MRGQGIELVRAGAEGKTGKVRRRLAEGRVEALGRVDARSDGSAALGQFVDLRQRLVQALNVLAGLMSIGPEFGTQAQRRRILKVGAADLDHVVEGLGLFQQHRFHPFQGWQQAVMAFDRQGDVHGRRHRIVGRLRHVDVVVRMDGIFGAEDAAQDLDRPVGDDLVQIHVGLGARSGLPDGQGEMIVPLAFGDLACGLIDGVAQFGVELAKLHVGPRGGLLLPGESADQGPRHGAFADREVFQGALGLRPPIAVGGNLYLADGVFLDAVGGC